MRHGLGCLWSMLVYLCASDYPVLELSFIITLDLNDPVRFAPPPRGLGIVPAACTHSSKPLAACLQEERAIEARRRWSRGCAAAQARKKLPDGRRGRDSRLGPETSLSDVHVCPCGGVRRAAGGLRV